MSDLSLGRLAVRTAVVVGIAVGGVLLGAALWTGLPLLLVLFGGLLLALFLQGIARFVQHRTPLGYGAAFGVTAFVLLLILGGVGWLISSQVGTQIDQLSQTIPEALGQLREALAGSVVGDWLLGAMPDIPALVSGAEPGNVGGDAGDAASSTGSGGSAESGENPMEGMSLTSLLASFAGSLANLAIALLIGIYAAISYRLYQRGFLHLVPHGRRTRAREVLYATIHAVRWWFVGRFASMLVVGALTTVGLYILGVPLALVLGLIAGLFSFVPYLGPILAIVPGVLVGLNQGTTTALYVFGLYILVQFLESYLITPLIQQKTVDLPPVVLLTAQFLLGSAGGALGVLVATPLAVALMVLVQTLYVEDAIGDEVHVLGS